MPIRYLPASQLARLELPYPSVADAIARTIENAARGTVIAAPKSVVLPPDGRYVMSTLALSDDPPLTAVKSLVLSPHTAAQGLPSIDGVVTLIDSHTGALCGLLDAKWVTAVRTAGLSLLAATSLARKGSHTVAFFGCGVQARAHLAALAASYPLTDVVLFGRGRANLDLITEQARGLGLAARETGDAADALRNADLIVSSLTRAPDRPPMLDARLIGPGAFAAITDLAEPWLPESLGAFDKLVVDDTQQEQAAEVKLADPVLVQGDLADLVLGRLAGRTADDERTAFVFRGLGLADLAIAVLAWQVAEQSGVGHLLPE